VSAQIASIIGLVVMFVVATALPINMGALGFALAFLVGTVFTGMSATAILAGFPGDLFVTLVGITYLFAIAQNNGTVDWLVHYSVRLVGGRISAIPWVMFAVSAVLTGIGAVSPGAVAIIAPIALRFAARYRIHPMLMGLMVVHGAQGGGFSPISIYGGITNQVVQRAGLPGDEIVLFLSSLAFNFLIALVIFFVFGGHRLALRRPGDDLEATVDAAQPDTSVAVRGHGGTPAVPAGPRPGAVVREGADDHVALDREQALTLTGLVVLAVASLAFSLNVGLVAMSVAVVLALVCPKGQKGAVDKVSWSTVLLIGGVITYIGVLQKAGAVDYVGGGVSAMAMPLLGALLLCYVAGVVSAFASSVAVLGATIPLAVPLLTQGHLGVPGLIAAIAISTTIVDVSPFSTNGALVVANAHGIDRDAFFRQMLIYSGIVVVVGPLLVWLALVVPGMF